MLSSFRVRKKSSPRSEPKTAKRMISGLPQPADAADDVAVVAAEDHPVGDLRIGDAHGGERDGRLLRGLGRDRDVYHLIFAYAGPGEERLGRVAAALRAGLDLRRLDSGDAKFPGLGCPAELAKAADALLAGHPAQRGIRRADIGCGVALVVFNGIVRRNWDDSGLVRTRHDGGARALVRNGNRDGIHAGGDHGVQRLYGEVGVRLHVLVQKLDAELLRSGPHPHRLCGEVGMRALLDDAADFEAFGFGPAARCAMSETPTSRGTASGS